MTALADGTFWSSGRAAPAAPAMVSADGAEWMERALVAGDAYVPVWSSRSAAGLAAGFSGGDDLVQDPADPHRWLLAGAASPMASADGGRTWRYQPGGMAATASWHVDFARSDPGRAYLATARGVFIVSDGGASGLTAGCSAQTFGGSHCFHKTMAAGDGRTVVAAGVDERADRSVIIRSHDAGRTWEPVTPRGLPANFDGITHAVMSLDDPDDFLVLLGSRLGHTDAYHDMARGGQPNSPGLYRTTDGGSTFARVAGDAFDGVDMGMRTHPENAFLERDGVDPAVRYLVLRAVNKPAAQGLWRSGDGGDTWVHLGDPAVGWRLAAFTVDPAVHGRLWAGGDLLRRSDDGGVTWTTVAGVSGISSLSACATRIAVLGRRGDGATSGVQVSMDDGATWAELTSPERRLAAARQVIVDPWRPGQVWIAGAQSITIAGSALALPAAPAPLPPLAGFVGEPLRMQLPVGPPSTLFAVAAGALPAGLSLDGRTGTINGVPRAAAAGEVTIEARSGAGTVRAALRLQIVGGGRLAVAGSARHVQPADSLGTLALAITNPGDAPLAWTLTAPAVGWVAGIEPHQGRLDPGTTATIAVRIDSEGLASGAVRSATVEIASDAATHPLRHVTVTLVVGERPPPPVIEPAQTVLGWQGGTLRCALRASGAPTGWAVVTGTMPKGLILDAHGALSGSPRDAGSSVLGIAATNDGGTSPTQAIVITIAPPAPGRAYDFNSGQAHFEETFAQNDGWPWGPASGVGGTGGLATDPNDRSGLLRTPAVTFTRSGQAAAVGISFQAKSDEGTTGGMNVRVGLSRSDSPPLTALDHLAAGVDRAAGSHTGSAIMVDVRAATVQSVIVAKDAATLIDRDWYRLDAVITYAGDARFTIHERLTHLGADGTASPVLISEQTATADGLSGLVGVPLYAGFRGMNCIGWGGVRAFDDFSAQVLPPPKGP